MIDPEVIAAISEELCDMGLGHFADDLTFATTSKEIAAVVDSIRLGGIPELANFISEEASLYLNP